MPQSKLTSQDIMPKVRTVLKKATTQVKGKNIFMTAYQILAALPDGTRNQLLGYYGQGGKNSGNIPAATKVVSEAAEMVPDVEIVYFDTRFAAFMIENGPQINSVTPSADYCGLFRLPDGSPKARRGRLAPGIRSATLSSPRRSRRSPSPAGP